MPSGARQACIASAISAGSVLERRRARGQDRRRPARRRGWRRDRAARRGRPQAAPARARDRAPPPAASASRRARRCRRRKLATASSRLRDRRRIGERRRQPLRQQARAGGGHGAVDRVEQRAAPLAGQRAHQFEIAAGRLVDRHGGAGAFAQRRRQRRPLADLRALDIGDAGRRGGELEPRQRAEGLAGRDRKERRQPPLGGGAVEHVARQRHHRRQRAPVGREIGIGSRARRRR